MTVHIPLPTSASRSSSRTLHSNLIALHALVTNSPGLSTRADIHLVLSPFPRALNAWRNIARLLAPTAYMLLLDVDFAVCTDWRASVRALLRDGENSVARRVREGRAALVLPAFEYVRQAEGRNQDTFPRDRHVRAIQFSTVPHLSHRVLLIDMFTCRRSWTWCAQIALPLSMHRFPLVTTVPTIVGFMPPSLERFTK